MSSKGDRPFTIVVEGNIGSGKTTLLQHFAALSTPAAPFETLQEPVSKWRDVKGHNTLGLMYDDPKRWSLTFQTYVQLTMVDLHARKTQKPNAIKMMERSIYSAKYCFVENLRKNGIMPEVEYTVLTEWFDWLIANQSCEVDLIIYLKTCPENVYDRIQERGRDEEMDITLDYLISLHRLHENWLMPKMCAADYVDHPNPAWFPVPAPVMIFDGDMRVHEIGEQIEQRMEEILEIRRAKMGRSSLARLPPAGTKSAPIELEEEEEDEEDSQNQERGASSSKRRVKEEDDSTQGRRKYSRKAKVLKVLN